MPDRPTELSAQGEWLERVFPLPRVPFGSGYVSRYLAFFRYALEDPALRTALRAGGRLPAHYGGALDERAVELPWTLAHIPRRRLLDAGSTLNHAFVLGAVLDGVSDLHVLTLAPEADAHWERGISYVFGDLRELPYRDGYFDAAACISTLEHVGITTATTA